jgi:hypothetical protein
MSLNELEALAYHEGVPGHHLQLSIQTNLGDVPPFRRFGGSPPIRRAGASIRSGSARTWASTPIPIPTSAGCRWSCGARPGWSSTPGSTASAGAASRAIAWLNENTPNPQGDIVKAIERYIVYPGQATAYMIGMLKILELREKARTELGDAVRHSRLPRRGASVRAGPARRAGGECRGLDRGKSR